MEDDGSLCKWYVDQDSEERRPHKEYERVVRDLKYKMKLNPSKCVLV